MFTRIYEVYTNHLANAMSFCYDIFDIFFTYTIDDLFNNVIDFVDSIERVPTYVVKLIDLFIEPAQSIFGTFFADATLFTLCFGASITIFIVLTLVKWLVAIIPVV